MIIVIHYEYRVPSETFVFVPLTSSHATQTSAEVAKMAQHLQLDHFGHSPGTAERGSRLHHPDLRQIRAFEVRVLLLWPMLRQKLKDLRLW